MAFKYQSGDEIQAGDVVENDETGRCVVVMVLEPNTDFADGFGCMRTGGVLLHSCLDGLQLWTKDYEEWIFVKKGGLNRKHT
jgi:hypothetical protein